MIIEEKDVCVLEKHIPDIRELIHCQNVTKILEMIDNLIVDDILEHGDEPSNVGRELQMIYDRVESKA